MATALAFSLVAALPVAADTELGHVGQVGVHSLRDTPSNGGALCRYVTISEGPHGHKWQLRRLDVRPPRMQAISGEQRLGWRFIVERTPKRHLEPWQVTYRSPIQKRTASTGSNAAFSSMGIKVNVPNPDDDFAYRVIVKMIWYQANGSQQGTARHSVDIYRAQFDDESVIANDRDGVCLGNEAIVGH
jgi:hypothetical protein